MKSSKQKIEGRALNGQAGMTLVEVVVATGIAALTVGGILTGYVFCATSSEFAALSLAANSAAMENIERTRSAKWDTSAYPVVDQLVATNFPTRAITLDVAGSGTGVISATIQTTISQISVTRPLRQIRVDCVWQFKGVKNVTNTVATCRAPDQ